MPRSSYISADYPDEYLGFMQAGKGAYTSIDVLFLWLISWPIFDQRTLATWLSQPHDIRGEKSFMQELCIGVILKFGQLFAAWGKQYLE